MAPTDLLPRGVLVGRVTAAGATCTDLTTDDGVTWCLTGDAGTELPVGAVVRARIESGEAHACRAARSARLVSIRVVR